jgi:hypothetical protein
MTSMKTFMNSAWLALVLASATGQLHSADSALVLATQLQLQSDLADKALPQWRDGMLTSLHQAFGPQIEIDLFGKTGSRHSALTFAVKDATRITVRSFDRAADGSLAFCGSLTHRSAPAHSYIAWISADGQQTHITHTSPFTATRVTFAPDGSIWSQGFELQPRAAGEAPRASMAAALRPDAAVFRQFSRSGQLLQALIRQSEISAPYSLTKHQNIFGSVGDRIVWYSGTTREFIAISSDGSISKVANLALPHAEELSGSAITSSGDIFASTRNGKTWSVSRLNLAERKWQPMAQGEISDRQDPQRRMTLLGADGETLVANGLDSRHLRFFRITKPQPR